MAAFEINRFILLLSLAVAPCACTKQAETAVCGGSTRIVATVGPMASPKVTMTQSSVSGGLDLSWQEGDAIRVTSAEGSGLFTICPGFTAHQAEFEGTPVGGKEFTVYCPGGKYQDYASILSRRLDSQVQNGNADTRHLEWNACVTSAGGYSHLDFSKGLQTAVLQFVVKLPEEVTGVTSLSFSSADSLFHITNDPEGPVTDSLVLAFTGLDFSSDHTLVAYLASSWHDTVLPQGTKLTLTLNAEPAQTLRKRLTVPSGGLVIRGGRVNSIRLLGGVNGDFSSNIEGFIAIEEEWN